MESSLETINHSKHLRSYADLSNFCTPISTRRFSLYGELSSTLFLLRRIYVTVKYV